MVITLKIVISLVKLVNCWKESAGMVVPLTQSKPFTVPPSGVNWRLVQEARRIVPGWSFFLQISFPDLVLTARRHVAEMISSPAMATTLCSVVGMSSQNLSHLQLFNLTQID